jgi:unsaturated chondroitin disaccharide hydrolase
MSLLAEAELEAALRLVLGRVARTLAETPSAFPIYCEATGPSDAPWVSIEDGNWCAGYWIGLLWLAAKHARSSADTQRFLLAAYNRLPALARQPTGHIFAGVNWFYAGFLGFDVTGDQTLRQRGIDGADAMLALYNESARQIPIGIYTTFPPNAASRIGPVDRRSIAAVDVIHTSIPILLRAHRETDEPAYRRVADSHARRHVELFVRPDGSTGHLVTFHAATCEPLRRHSTLAQSDDGCWSRGFGWHIAGLASCFVATGEDWIVEILNRSMAYYIAHAGTDLVPAWDLAIADPGAKRDSSAAALVAYGLTLLRTRPDSRTDGLVVLGERVLASLLSTCLVRDGTAANAGAILHGCYRHPPNVATDAELIWSDFYVAAALDLLKGSR